MKRIVGLVAGRNEAGRIAFCLGALSRLTDAIVYLDDCSTDGTADVVEAGARKWGVERIVRKRLWVRDEPKDRNTLLAEGRRIGGTHFVAVDVDEAFTANCLRGGALRNAILDLAPGDCVAVRWIHPWRGIDRFRCDDSPYSSTFKPLIFADDGRSAYESDFIHTPRAPAGLSGARLALTDRRYGLLHFQFVNWRNHMMKQAWYRCLERIRHPARTAEEINRFYSVTKDESGLVLAPIAPEWIAGYEGLDLSVWNAPETWRERQILDWFGEHGVGRFVDLDIWDAGWDKTGFPSETVPHLEEALLHRPANADILAALCALYARAGRDADAAELADRIRLVALR